MKRLRIEVAGLVQGVGFRPFIHRLAMTHSLAGTVRNSWQGVSIEVEGRSTDLERFLKKIYEEKPIAANIVRMETYDLEVKGEEDFKIVASIIEGMATAAMPHDRAPCFACLSELYEPSNRRFRYPFISCHDCGPRFTIAEALPFDRDRTTMKAFRLCHMCQSEYGDPHNRRFHAQTISCAICGPKLLYLDAHGSMEHAETALTKAAALIRGGGLIAVKGIGGYQLVCSALARQSIVRIRKFKERKLKPFAVMATSLAEALKLCSVSSLEQTLLISAVAPVVLLYVKDLNRVHEKIHPEIAPTLPTLGVMLPSSPLHRLLIDAVQCWLVVTSANRHGETMYIDDGEAKKKLGSLADAFLFHDLAIAHLADDSVVRATTKRMIVLRHARGLAPSELKLAAKEVKQPVFGLGGHSKSAFAVAVKNRLILSQHLGDLDSKRSREILQNELQSYENLYAFDSFAGRWCHDAHPDYGSTAIAKQRGEDPIAVFHHEAHLEALVAEKGLYERSLGVVCDGSGLGEGHSIWGGEFFLLEGDERRRIASLLPFRLPGGEKAIKEARRSACGLLFEACPNDFTEHPFLLQTFTKLERNLLASAMRQDINAPYTSSLGRLFDGFAALLGLCEITDYEAQAAMAMEALAQRADKLAAPFPILWQKDARGLWRWDWRNIVAAAFSARESESDRISFAAAFHYSIVQAIYDLACQFDANTILLTGGVFQNAVLVELCESILGEAGKSVVTHQAIPSGDGGLALGQIAVAIRRTHVSWRPR